MDSQYAGAIYLSHREFHMPQQDALSSAQKKKAPYYTGFRFFSSKGGKGLKV